MEVFEQFRSFFSSVLHVNTFIFAVPITIKFRYEYFKNRNNPVFCATCISAFIAIFKSYPSIGDSCLYFSLLAMHPEIFKYAQYSYFALTSICYASFLGPLFYNLWVYVGGGNSNFFYAITLVYSLSQVILISDLMFAALRRDWERQNPGWRRMRIDITYK